MPLYVAELTVPAGTPEDLPVRTELEVKDPIIVRFEFHFPDGVCTLALCRVLYGIKQLCPLPEGAWLTGNNETVGVLEHHELPELPAILVFEGCSPDARYDHVLRLRVVAVRKEIARPWDPLARIIRGLGRLIGMGE